ITSIFAPSRWVRIRAHQQRPQRSTLAYSRYDQGEIRLIETRQRIFLKSTLSGQAGDRHVGQGTGRSRRRFQRRQRRTRRRAREAPRRSQADAAAKPKLWLPAPPGRQCQLRPLVGNSSTNSTPSTSFSMLNAKDILLEKRFVSIEDKRAARALAERKRSTDSTNAPGRHYNEAHSGRSWSRVVAVFVQGRPGSSRTGIGNGQGIPVDIFARVKAFHLKFADMPTDANVLQWNVTVLQLDRGTSGIGQSGAAAPMAADSRASFAGRLRMETNLKRLPNQAAGENNRARLDDRHATCFDRVADFFDQEPEDVEDAMLGD
uniref:CDC73_C domain-containing protein n=1 Tax=Macrostomum lignano TaxID=282301 RepID=A0A1I8JNN4_9PLAT